SRFNDASLATHVGWKCSFDYAVKEDTVDIGESDRRSFEWHWVMWTNLFNATVTLVVAVILLRRDRRIADQYMAATSGQRRGRVLKKHRKLRIVVIVGSVAGFILAGLYGSAALYGMT
ncbi:hypothetical protein AAVH_32267, partial [Aphelenchoides avenae]